MNRRNDKNKDKIHFFKKKTQKTLLLCHQNIFNWMKMQEKKMNAATTTLHFASRSDLFPRSKTDGL